MIVPGAKPSPCSFFFPPRLCPLIFFHTNQIAHYQLFSARQAQMLGKPSIATGFLAIKL